MSEKTEKSEEYPKIQLDPLIEEYKTIREEILRRHDTRIKTLQFTIVAIGAVIGIMSVLLRFGLTGEAGFNLQILASTFLIFSIFGIIIIGAALILTITNTRQMYIIGAYIRKFIEKEIPNLNYETRLKKFRENNSEKSLFLLIGTNKALSIFYLLLISPFFILSVYPWLIGNIVLNNVTIGLWVIFFVFLLLNAYFALKLIFFHIPDPWEDIK